MSVNGMIDAELVQKKNCQVFEVEFECAEYLPAFPKTCKMHFVLIFVIFAFQSVHSNHFSHHF